MADFPSTRGATVPDEPAAAARTALKTRLTAAMKVRDRVAMAALRSALGAIDNAEAVEAEAVDPEAVDPEAMDPEAVHGESVDAEAVGVTLEPPGPPAMSPATSEYVAGGVPGVGAAEVARRTLSAAQVRAVIVAEITDRTTAIDSFPSDDQRAVARSSALRREIDVLTDVLDELEP